jgi:hypothetical protein
VTSAQVAAVYLTKGTTVVKQVSGSQVASGVYTFDGLNENIARNGDVNYDILLDLVDDANQAGNVLTTTIQSISVEDEDSDDVTATGLPGVSARDVTVSGVGTLTIAVDNTDNETDKVKNVLANTTSSFVASYELTAVNENVLIKDLSVVASDADFVDAVSEVILYANDKTTEISREPVTTTTVTFDNINYVANEGNENLYVKVVARKIGKNAAGKLSNDITLTVQATDVEGDDSGKAITTGAGVASATSASLAFKTVPVKISSVGFVSSYGGETVTSNITNGENTVGIIAITADSTTNSNSTDGSSLKTELESLVVTLNTDATEFDNDGAT